MSIQPDTDRAKVRPLEPVSPTQPDASPETERTLIAILGNPNAGKSTLFNRLTDLRQKVGNYAGVTVEKKVGTCTLPSGRTVDVLDLPGSYSLQPGSPDEMIVRDVLFGLNEEVRSPDLVVFVVDATQLDRHLYLALQLIEVGRPVVLALNMVDAAAAEGIEIDEDELQKQLGVPVVSLSASRGTGIGNLRRLMDRDVEPSLLAFSRRPPQVTRMLKSLASRLPRRGLLSDAGRLDLAMALLLDDGEDDAIARYVPPEILDDLRILRTRLDEAHPDWRTDDTAGIYETIEHIMERAVRRPGERRDRTRDRIDRVLTHRVFGPIFFVLLMGAIFQSIFEWASPAMDLIDSGIGMLGAFVGGLLPAGPIRSLVVDGVIAGVGATVIFVPQIAVLFFFISVMEGTGYMARAAFIMDRLMGRVGLPGRAFIPLLSSFACAIPGIMAARTIDNRRDRITTIMIAPFMSCSARLPVYALLIGAFVPDVWIGFATLPGITLFSMYFLGIAAAILVAWALKRTALRGGKPLYVMELPPYRLPSLRSVLMIVWERSLLFLRKAGTVILAVSIVLWFLASYPSGGPEVNALEQRLAVAEAAADETAAHELRNEIAGVTLQNSFAGRAGRLMEPLIEPLGFDWKIGIALITSFAAREVMVATMATVFNLGEDEEGFTPLREKMKSARDPETGELMYTPLKAISLMVFFVLACQCMSTVAVVKRETNGWTWPIVMIVVMNTMAYGASLLVYQGGRALGLG
ncbi:MAG: ferrous iron transport protein B [Gemmatimonadetes bacterium]|nr:ferrous iron transport protein B [Gemmatimonadota bacterium]